MKNPLAFLVLMLLFLSCKPIAVFHWKKNGVRFVSKKKPNGDNANGFPNHSLIARIICFDELCRNKAKWMAKQKQYTIKVKDHSKKKTKTITPVLPSPIPDSAKQLQTMVSVNLSLPVLAQPIENKKNGGIEVQKSSVSVGKVFAFKNLNFETGTSVISKSSKASLDSVINILKDNPRLTIQIMGHTDQIGSENGNMKLSWERAEAVSKQFVLSGIPKNRIKTFGFGSTKPLTKSTAAEDRKRNRRVEFYFLEN